jgi:hypothetical protein
LNAPFSEFGGLLKSGLLTLYLHNVLPTLRSAVLLTKTKGIRIRPSATQS